MKDEHLIEIVIKIIKSDGPLARSIYIKELLSSIDENEYSELQSILNDSKYAQLNIFDKYLVFAHDYLKRKKITISNIIPLNPEEFEFSETAITYLDNMILDDKLMNKKSK